jgi:hypothetical protein
VPSKDFKNLWTAYAVSTYGTWIAFGAFPLLAVRELHVSPIAVSLLEAAGLVSPASAASSAPVSRHASSPATAGTAS